MWPPDSLRPLRCVLLVAAIAFGVRGAAETKVGDLFPDLAAASLEGTLPDTAGKVVLVDFWASWCAPCKASFPAYARLHAAYRERGLVVVAVSVDEEEPAYAAFVRRMAPPFAVVRDREQKLVRTVMVPAMPTSFLVGRDGRVRLIVRGFHGGDSEELLRTQVETLLASSPSSP